MKTARPGEYKTILLRLHHAQLETLNEMKRDSGQSRQTLIRDAIAISVGRYLLARQQNGGNGHDNEA